VGGQRRPTRSTSSTVAWTLLTLAVGFGAAGMVLNTVPGNPSKLSKTAVLEYGGSAIVCWIIAVVLVALAVSRFNRARRAAETERAEAMASARAREHLERARGLAEQLLAGDQRSVTPLWDVVLGAGEQVLLDDRVQYSRYYGLGGQAAYAQVSIRHYGDVRPTTALVDHAVAQAGNRGRAQAAAFHAATRWREQQQCRVVVTDRRVLCQVQATGWVTFEHARVSAIQPVPATGSVVLEFRDAAPLCLSGPIVTEIMVGVVWALYGPAGLREHPALTEVSQFLPSPHPGVSEPTSSSQPGAAALGDAAVPSPVAAPAAAAATGSADDDLGPGLLVWLAGRQLVHVKDAVAHLGLDEPKAVRILDALVADGLVSRVRVSDGSPVLYRVTRHGLITVDGDLRVPGPVDLASLGVLGRGSA
jgi:hypothetical protein